jgi:hypothetical protein
MFQSNWPSSGAKVVGLRGFLFCSLSTQLIQMRMANWDETWSGSYDKKKKAKHQPKMHIGDKSENI